MLASPAREMTTAARSYTRKMRTLACKGVRIVLAKVFLPALACAAGPSSLYGTLFDALLAKDFKAVVANIERIPIMRFLLFWVAIFHYTLFIPLLKPALERAQWIREAYAYRHHFTVAFAVELVWEFIVSDLCRSYIWVRHILPRASTFCKEWALAPAVFPVAIPKDRTDLATLCPSFNTTTTATTLATLATRWSGDTLVDSIPSRLIKRSDTTITDLPQVIEKKRWNYTRKAYRAVTGGAKRLQSSMSKASRDVPAPAKGDRPELTPISTTTSDESFVSTLVAAELTTSPVELSPVHTRSFGSIGADAATFGAPTSGIVAGPSRGPEINAMIDAQEREWAERIRQNKDGKETYKAAIFKHVIQDKVDHGFTHAWENPVRKAARRRALQDELNNNYTGKKKFKVSKYLAWVL